MTRKTQELHGQNPSPLDVIFERVNALGGYTNPKDPVAVAWAKEHEAVLDLIEAYRTLEAKARRPQVAA